METDYLKILKQISSYILSWYNLLQLNIYNLCICSGNYKTWVFVTQSDKLSQLTNLRRLSLVQTNQLS